jgi:hypothetical protein
MLTPAARPGPGAHAPARPRRGRAALSAAIALVTVGALAGCVGGSGNGSGGGVAGASVLGGWSLQTSDTACRETLAFAADDTFLHSVALRLQEQSSAWLLGGTYSGGSATDGSGSLAMRVVPDRSIAPPLLTYCAQWSDGSRQDWSFAYATAVPGTPLDDLSWRPLELTSGATAWVGTDAARTDHFALVQAGGALHGVLLEGALQGGQELFHREPATLPLRYPNVGGNAVLNLPQFAYRATFPGATANTPQQSLLLSVHDTVDVRFAGAGGLPLCGLAVYGTVDFSVPPSPNPLVPTGNELTMTLYPGGSPTPLLTAVGDDSETLYLLPVQVLGTADPNGCGIAIRARPTAARLLEEHLAAGQADAFTLPLVTGPAYLWGVPAGRPGGVQALPLGSGVGWPASRLLPVLLQPATGGDVLGLLAGAPQDLRLTVQDQGTQRYLSVYPQGSGVGLGPLQANDPPQAPQPLQLPANFQFTLKGPATVSAQFTLDAARVLRIESSDPVADAGTLRDAAGNQLAAAQGGAPGGGLRIVAALEPGTYSLAIDVTGAPASFTLSFESAPDAGVSDPRLAACLLRAGVDGDPPSALRRADCSRQGIAALDGIAAYSGLQALALDDDPLADTTALAPLAGLPALAGLSLAGTPTAELAPLGSLRLLHRLSLAGWTLDAAALTTLQGLGALTELDLRAATGPTAADLTALQGALPDAWIVAPDGSLRSPGP